jgi:hypothetical protein
MAWPAKALEYVVQESVSAYLTPREQVVNVLGHINLTPAQASLAQGLDA